MSLWVSCKVSEPDCRRYHCGCTKLTNSSPDFKAGGGRAEGKEEGEGGGRQVCRTSQQGCQQSLLSGTGLSLCVTGTERESHKQ